MKYFLLVIRILIGGMFVLAGVAKIVFPEAFISMMQGANMVFIQPFLWAAILLEIAGGIALIVGFRTKWAAIALLAFTVIVSFVIHTFWSLEGEAAQQEMFFFLKNVVIVGLLFLIIKFGSGRFALENRIKSAQ